MPDLTSNLATLKPLKVKGIQPQRRRTKIYETPSTCTPATAEHVFSRTGWKRESSLKHSTPGSSSEYKEKLKYPRISKPVELIKHDYDVVVIGSGYGGGVAASRMARGRQSVCVLEMGRERWPGEYPVETSDVLGQLHVSGDFSTRDIGPAPVSHGDDIGLYHLILGENQNAFVANGLGGTSLLNANVFLEADTETLKTPSWPPEIRRNPQCLKKYYDRAREVLEPQIYPDHFPPLPKLELLKDQAEALGCADKFRKVEQTTWFRDDGLNSSGVKMKTSTLSGKDSTGVNDGSKSSVLMNYLADAWNWGAEIFTKCEVRYVKKHPTEGYIVFFAWHGGKRQRFKDTFYDDLMWVHAKKMVFLGAGALGTTEILLRSQEVGLEMSRNIGQNISGNGDILAFGYNLDRKVNGVAREKPLAGEPIGPTINGIIDCRDQANPLDGYVIEEGAIPSVMAPIMEPMLAMLPGRVKPIGLGPAQQAAKAYDRIESLFSGGYAPSGSIQKTQTYLIMSHDENQATLSLKDNKPNLQFRGVGRNAHVGKLLDKLELATTSFGGTFVNQPFYALNSQQAITVHPIGGVSMSEDGTGAGGASNHMGEVFIGEGAECHDGLVAVDGSVIPAALGANPFATITALAERSVELMAKKYGIEIDYTTKNGELDLWGHPEHPLSEAKSLNESFVSMALRTNKEGLEFTEIMSGYVHIGGDIDDFEVAARIAKGHCQAARFFLSVHAYDANELLTSTNHKAMLTGTFTSGALPASPYMVTGGDWYCFEEDMESPETKTLKYIFDMVGTDGSKIHFEGKKIVNDSSAFSIINTWRATTTLQVTLSKPTKDKIQTGEILGKGILVIRPQDLLCELRTFVASVRSTTSFLTWFAKNIAHTFFAPLDNMAYPIESYRPFSFSNEPSAVFPIYADDEVRSTMMLWEPTTDTKQHMDLLFIGGASVDHSIFALPTIKLNAIRYFRDLGYRCFFVNHRTGKNRNAKCPAWTTYHARLDIAAAINRLEELRETKEYGELAPKTYIIAHCAGSVALSAGLLDGSINTSSIAGITASQAFMTPKFALVNRLKAAIPYATTAYKALSWSNWYDCISTPTDKFFQLGLNQLLRFYPVWREDICTSVVCHRTSFIFGLMWCHKNLNEATHKNLHQYIGGTTMRNQDHLIKMGTKGHVLTADGSDTLVTSENIQRLKGIPILFMSGLKSGVYDPENTLTSYGMLRQELDEGCYDRQVLKDYGHLDIWMSDKSAEDVFPRVRDHLAKALTRMQDQGVNGFAADGDFSG